MSPSKSPYVIHESDVSQGRQTVLSNRGSFSSVAERNADELHSKSAGVFKTRSSRKSPSTSAKYTCELPMTLIGTWYDGTKNTWGSADAEGPSNSNRRRLRPLPAAPEPPPPGGLPMRPIVQCSRVAAAAVSCDGIAPAKKHQALAVATSDCTAPVTTLARNEPAMPTRPLHWQGPEAEGELIGEWGKCACATEPSQEPRPAVASQQRMNAVRPHDACPEGSFEAPLRPNWHGVTPSVAPTPRR